MIVYQQYLKFLLVFVVLFLGFGCSTDKSITGETKYIDPALVGNWYLPLEENLLTHNLGVKIQENGDMLRNGINNSTGELILLENQSAGKIISAKDGEITFSESPGPDTPTVIRHLKYRLTDDGLIFAKSAGDFPFNLRLNKHYLKGEVGEIVADPIPDHMEMTINNITYSNLSYPDWPFLGGLTVFASKYFDDNNDPYIRVTSSIFHPDDRYDHYDFTMKISSFTGIGTYNLGENSDNLITIEKRNPDERLTTDHPASGELVMKSFDGKICSGTFDIQLKGESKTLAALGNFHFYLNLR